MRRPSPALIVAVIALIVAMSGTSYAVTQLPRNSVGAPQLKTNAVTAPKVKANAITGAKVKDGSLNAKDFAAGTLLQGPKGDTGAPGATGAPGPTGPSTSAAAWNIPTTPLPMIGAFQEVISLGAVPTGENDSTGTITVSTASNLVLDADLTFREVTGTGSARIGCLADYRSVPSGTWDSLVYGYVTFVALAPSAQSSLAPVGLQAVPAGTYDVRLRCQQYAGLGIVEFTHGALTVVATGR